MDAIKTIVEKLKTYIRSADNEPFNYERYLCVDKAPYLDAFVNDIKMPPFELEIQMSSICNLRCRWCIGDEVQSAKQVLKLPNILNKDNINRVVDGILSLKENNQAIEIVKFSGFIGEPLIQKEATLVAIQRLAGAGLKVGLFTNGIYLTEDTWSTLSNIDYIHISLDAGPSSFYWLKEDSKGGAYSKNTFNTVINNLKGLHEYRQRKAGSSVKLNIGYVIIAGNHEEIYKTTELVKEAGADMIRFKCDIAGKHNLAKANLLDEVFSQIEKAKNDFHHPPEFSVYTIHSRQEMEERSYSKWNCSKGCYYQFFATTIGSDGNLYICDHNTMPGAIPIGNVIDRSLKDIWLNDRHRYLADGVKYICQSNVCPPFANRVNVFLNEIVELKKVYGSATVIDVLNVLREEIKY